MASAPSDSGCSLNSSLEDELKRLLQDEADHRQQFISQVLNLMERWKRLEMDREEVSVPSLIAELQRADNMINPLLLKCHDLCLASADEDCRRKEKTREQRDSGFTPSSDVEALKRQALFVPTTELSGDGPCPDTNRQPATPLSGAPGKQALAQEQPAAEPTQHTDGESSDAESGTS
ncbi:uncharacterized protein LOC143293142 [Babylonia areolata]|uniref:uncharacterized protein LOC143293142 n=1 Tax=Babylonia areolata TaxID=304850 RepID=UPI003FD00517